MSASISIDVQDTATPALRLAIQKLSDRSSLHAAMAFRVEDRVRRHLEEKNGIPNNLGGKKTNYWLNASRTTKVSSNNIEGTVSFSYPGVALHFFGGIVVPKEKNWLTIPARTEAHGKTASQIFGSNFADSKWLFNRNRQPFAIAKKSDGLIYFWLTKKARIPKDPTVLPPTGAMQDAAVQAAQDFVTSEGLL